MPSGSELLSNQGYVGYGYVKVKLSIDLRDPLMQCVLHHYSKKKNKSGVSRQ